MFLSWNLVTPSTVEKNKKRRCYCITSTTSFKLKKQYMLYSSATDSTACLPHQSPPVDWSRV